jgi:phosphatidylserine/phosphatidylglycerophosphate/cardiolipin synthase-like enzyme
MKKIFLYLLILFILIGLFNIYKPLPDGLSKEGKIYKVSNDSVTFLSDKTYLDENLERQSEQQIFDEVFNMINNAENFILIDMFLFNEFQGKEKNAYRNLSGELVENLINKKSENESLGVVLITDPINQIYGTFDSEVFNEMEKVGIKIIETKIKKLRDSNPTYSSPWRTVLQFLPVGFIKLPNPFSEVHEKVGLDSYLTLINFKANHRKVIVSDYLDENGQLKMSSLVTSANPHDGSSAHHNVAIKIDDFIWRDIIDSEYSVIDFSSNLDIEKPSEDNYIDESGDVNVQLLTEEKIRKSIINEINNASEGDNIKMVMFYISDRKIIKSIKRAYDRGVDIEIILDPNKDAFGREKNGVPNVSVAREFKNVDEDFKIKWCNTHGEQCHSKLLIINKNESNIMFIGSANFTKRNIGDYNLETNIKVWGTDVSSINEANNYFSELWNNKNREYTVDYGAYKDESLLKYIQYRFMEKTGISSF